MGELSLSADKLGKLLRGKEGGRKDTFAAAPGFSTAGASAPVAPAVLTPFAGVV